MPAAIFCPKCGQKSRSERHLCQPSALQKQAQRRKALAAIQAANVAAQKAKKKR